MWSVLATTGDVAQLDDFVVLVIAIGVLTAIERCGNIAAVDNDVEAVEGTQQTLCTGEGLPFELDVQSLDLGLAAAANGRRSDSAQSSFPRSLTISRPFGSVVMLTHEPSSSLGTVNSRSTRKRAAD